MVLQERRRDSAVMVLGGPTTVLDLGGLRIVVDPTFDAPGPHGYLTKTAGPALEEAELGPVDVVLVSHSAHPDNLDTRGRAFAVDAPLVLTCPSAAAELGPRALGLRPWDSHSVGDDVVITAVPAVHGPQDAPRDEGGNVNCEVTGFLVSGADVPTIYVSGDNASIRVVVEVARRIRASMPPSSSPARPVSARSSSGRPLTSMPSARPRRGDPGRRRSWCPPTTTGGPTSPRPTRTSPGHSSRRATPRCCASPITARGFRSTARVPRGPDPTPGRRRRLTTLQTG